MFYKQVTIVGVGLIGGSLGLAMKQRKLCETIIGISSPATIKKALKSGVIDQGFPREELGQRIKNSEVIFLCAPVNTIISHLEFIGSTVEKGVIISDVGSTKQAIMNTAARSLSDEVYFIGGHPLAGSENQGVDAAFASLFENKPYVLIPDERVPEKISEKFSRFIRSLGARVIFLDSKVHDAVVAAVSHLPQLAAVGLMNTIGELNEGTEKCYQLAAGGFRDMTRIASSPYSMWKDICETNQENIQKMLTLYIKKLERLRDIVGQNYLQK